MKFLIERSLSQIGKAMYSALRKDPTVISFKYLLFCYVRAELQDAVRCWLPPSGACRVHRDTNINLTFIQIGLQLFSTTPLPMCFRLCEKTFSACSGWIISFAQESTFPFFRHLQKQAVHCIAGSAFSGDNQLNFRLQEECNLKKVV